jgi:hypothetical protein
MSAKGEAQMTKSSDDTGDIIESLDSDRDTTPRPNPPSDPPRRPIITVPDYTEDLEIENIS